jgi:hypothetical protein
MKVRRAKVLIAPHGNPLRSEAVAGFRLNDKLPQTLRQPCNTAIKNQVKPRFHDDLRTVRNNDSVETEATT